MRTRLALRVAAKDTKPSIRPPRPGTTMFRLEPLTNLFDLLDHYWEHPRTQRRVALALIFAFIGGIIAIELNRRGLLAGLPVELTRFVPSNHFQAVNFAFTMLLVLEVMSLILVLSCSLSRSVGKQFEILALILLRNSFKELSHMHEPITLSLDFQPVLHIIVSASAALVIFLCLGLYYKVQRPQGYITSAMDRMHYVMAKKILALGLFLAFIGIALWDGWMFATTGQSFDFFETIYTVLIFADILMVLVAQTFMPSFHAVFRNSGYVIATLLMRIALGAPPFWDAAVGIVSALFALALTWAIRVFPPSSVSSSCS